MRSETSNQKTETAPEKQDETENAIWNTRTRRWKAKHKPHHKRRKNPNADLKHGGAEAGHEPRRTTTATLLKERFGFEGGPQI
jgi:hypothetical protein